jgi:hypothetical protein
VNEEGTQMAAHLVEVPLRSAGIDSAYARGVDGVLQRAEQRLIVERTIVSRPIDEEGRRVVHPAPDTAHEVLADPIGMHVLGELVVASVEIESESLSVGL